jgi:hypothetical protein
MSKNQSLYYVINKLERCSSQVSSIIKSKLNSEDNKKLSDNLIKKIDDILEEAQCEAEAQLEDRKLDIFEVVYKYKPKKDPNNFGFSTPQVEIVKAKDIFHARERMEIKKNHEWNNVEKFKFIQIKRVTDKVNFIYEEKNNE